MPYKKTVWVPGGAPGISAARLNNFEQGIMDAYYQSGMTPLANCTTQMEYTEGALTAVLESVGGKLVRRTDLAYANGSLSTVRVRVYDDATVVRDWVDTMQYSDGVFTGVEREVNI